MSPLFISISDPSIFSLIFFNQILLNSLNRIYKILITTSTNRIMSAVSLENSIKVSNVVAIPNNAPGIIKESFQKSLSIIISLNFHITISNKFQIFVFGFLKGNNLILNVKSNHKNYIYPHLQIEP